jgi:hypothetical protein
MRTHKDYRRIRKGEWERWKTLADNKEFVWETFCLKYQLKQLFTKDPDALRIFFRPGFRVDAPRSQATKRRIEQVVDDKLKKVLDRYASYAQRYGVEFSLHKPEPYFRVWGTGFGGNKFHVEIRDGGFRAIGRARALGGAIESDEVPVPSKLQGLVRKGQAKYVRIDDGDDFSILRQLTSFAYSPDQVTVVDYGSTSRHQFYLVGEHVPLNRIWPVLQKVVTEFQRELGGHDQRGRQTNVRRLYAQLQALVRSNNSMKNVAAALIEQEDRRAEMALDDRKSGGERSERHEARGATQSADLQTRRDKAQSYLSQLTARLKR